MLVGVTSFIHPYEYYWYVTNIEHSIYFQIYGQVISLLTEKSSIDYGLTPTGYRVTLGKICEIATKFPDTIDQPISRHDPKHIQCELKFTWGIKVFDFFAKIMVSSFGVKIFTRHWYSSLITNIVFEYLFFFMYGILFWIVFKAKEITFVFNCQRILLFFEFLFHILYLA